MTKTMSNLEYLRHAIALGRENSGFRGRGNVFLELAKMELMEKGETPDPILYENIDGALRWIDERNDCADFLIPGLVRILRQHRGTDRLKEGQAQKIEDSLVGFKYWLDEPGEVHACYFTENHQILFHSAEYLVGQLFPKRIFPSNNQSGEWHRQHAIPFIRRWIDWRARFGFSEWLAQGYYTEDILAMLGLMTYAEEEDIRLKSKLIIDQLLFDMAVNAFRGSLCGTHGRAYTHSLIDPNSEGVAPVMGLMWGEGYMGRFSDCATLMAVYDYRCPKAIREVALDKPAIMINKERMSINVCDAKYYGVDPADFDNIMLFWGIQAYSDRLVVENSTKVYPYWNWMLNRVHAYKEMYELCDAAGIPSVSGTPDYTAMTQVDIYTYKTPDYMLSCAQDFRKGRMGYQQHPWTASLGGRALVFTNSPGSNDYTSRPNQLAGNLNLPRAVAHQNVQLCIYRINPDFVDYLYSHAYFPQHEFDEVDEAYGWVFGRKDSAYIAMRSLRPGRWMPVRKELYDNPFRRRGASDEMAQIAQRAKPFEYMAPGHANVWAFEMGSAAQNGNFQAFKEGFKSAALEGDTFAFTYQSPSQGEMRFGWNKPLLVQGKEMLVKDYKRYENPYCTAEFNSERLEIRFGKHLTVLDHAKPEFADE